MDLNSILIGSEDPQRLADYHTKLFGEPGWNMEGYVGWQVGSGGFTVGRTTRCTERTTSPAGSCGTSRPPT